MKVEETKIKIHHQEIILIKSDHIEETWLVIIKPINHSGSIITEDDLSGECKIQLTIQITFISSLDTGEIGLKKW